MNPFPLQQAIYSALTGDSTLATLVTGIYDHVPSDAAYPFVALGEAQIRDWSNAEKQGSQQQLTLRIYSRETGRKQAAAIMERITVVLHAGVSVAGHDVASLRFTGSNITLDKDGMTYQGMLNFRALLTTI